MRYDSVQIFLVKGQRRVWELEACIFISQIRCILAHLVETKHNRMEVDYIRCSLLHLGVGGVGEERGGEEGGGVVGRRRAVWVWELAGGDEYRKF